VNSKSLTIKNLNNIVERLL